MSFTRSRNKCCLSLDNATNNTSSTAYLSRWSEVVPPKTALTFAALWDPDEGMVTFSGAELLESESLSGMPSHVFDDEEYSQFISVERDADDITITGENTATLATFQDAFNAFLQYTPADSKEHPHARADQGASRCPQTRASSTFDGLDVYSHDVQLKSKRSVRLSRMDLSDMESLFHTSTESARFRLGSELMHDLYRAGSEMDSGSGNRPANLGSRFSATTISTSNYIDVPDSAPQGTHTRETTPVPVCASPNACASPTGSSSYLPPRRGVLRKRRPCDGDTTPTGTRSPPSTPRKTPPKSWTPTSPASASPSSPSLSCPYPSTATTAVFSSSASAIRVARRRRLSRPVHRPITPASTPPTSPGKSSRLRLRFTFFPWKSRQTPPDEDGWVCIDITPMIRQRFVADLDED